MMWQVGLDSGKYLLAKQKKNTKSGAVQDNTTNSLRTTFDHYVPPPSNGGDPHISCLSEDDKSLKNVPKDLISLYL